MLISSGQSAIAWYPGHRPASPQMVQFPAASYVALIVLGGSVLCALAHLVQYLNARVML